MERASHIPFFFFIFICVCVWESCLCVFISLSRYCLVAFLFLLSTRKWGFSKKKDTICGWTRAPFESVAGWFAAFRHVFFSESTDFITRSKTFASFFVATHSDCSLILKCATYAFVLFCRLEIWKQLCSTVGLSSVCCHLTSELFIFDCRMRLHEKRERKSEWVWRKLFHRNAMRCDLVWMAMEKKRWRDHKYWTTICKVVQRK